MSDGQTTRNNVNHPEHYNSHPSGIECIDVVRHHNFNVGNAIKYLWRAGLKEGNSEIQELEKAAWYIRDEIRRLKREEQLRLDEMSSTSFVANILTPPQEAVSSSVGNICVTSSVGNICDTYQEKPKKEKEIPVELI